ncbi:hypothetical protein TPSD3_11795 [Thioflexithrix psekupsensis]|uniref:Uncharacterized protein n=2 Tax=Thioflexithrix psekupsensis TaxID=1570016 RepID=A0A251X6Q8_9GAMM|nr:hypothetical protein TPSD3_11795 [Thioflexithrix psekupsensis]
MSELAQKETDYGSPSQFLMAMLGFTMMGYYVEALMGVWTMITLTIWFVFTAYFYINWRKCGGTLGDGGWFSLVIITASVAGFFIERWLNVESYVLLLIWTLMASFAYLWLKENTGADARIYYLLSGQFLIVAIIMPLLMRYINPELMGLCAASHEAVGDHHGVDPHLVALSVIKTANTVTFLFSLGISWVAFRLASSHKKISD